MTHTNQPAKPTNAGQRACYQVSVCLSPDEEQQLARIADSLCSGSHSQAGRVAIDRWHSYLSKESQRSRFSFKPRPEFAARRSPQSGAKLVKFYFTCDEMGRLESLKQITGESVVGRLVRGAIGWYVERLNERNG